MILRTGTTSRPTCRFASTQPAPVPGPSAVSAQLHARRLRRRRGRRPIPIPSSSTPTSTDRRTRARSGASPRRSDTSWRTGIPRRWARSSTTPISASSTRCFKTAGPSTGAEFFDPSNSATYQTDHNRIRDYDATNKPWPEVVAELLSFYGFGMRWVCSTDASGQPYDYLEVYRKDAAGPTDPKPIYLPETGSDLCTALVNVAAMHAAFDYQAVANSFSIETAPERYEVSVILAPGYQPQAGDGTAANRVQFRKSALDASNATATTRAKYRFYIADECGDGHWSLADSQWLTTPIDFSSVFQLPNGNPDNLPTYVRRYRPGRNTLFSKDLNNKPLQAQLAVSRNYAGADPPCVWDTVSGTWQQIDGGWSLMEDRLGIEVTVDDPESWTIGKPPAGTAAQEPTGVLHGITSMANPSTTIQSEKMFWLRLTTVIEADYGIEATAARRDASPMSSTIIRRVDARDHFHYDVVDASSAFNQSPGTDQVVQDDSDAALAHACQLRSAHEFPPLAAAVTIPMLVDYVQIGDRISQINGRDVSFLVNAGIEQGEAPSYPFVVGLTWDFQASKQSTTLQLADRRLEPSTCLIPESNANGRKPSRASLIGLHPSPPEAPPHCWSPRRR